MSRRNRSRGSGGGASNNGELDLKLNLTPGPPIMMSSSSESESSPARSCVSSEDSGSSPETTSMVLVGCPRCLMYVMLSEADPRCPKCKSSVLLDFLRTTNNH